MHAPWLAKVAGSFDLPMPGPTTIYNTDNIHFQLLLSTKGDKSTSRWLTLSYLFVKDAVARGHISMRRVDTKMNTADGFTKALAKEQVASFVKQLGLS